MYSISIVYINRRLYVKVINYTCFITSNRTNSINIVTFDIDIVRKFVIIIIVYCMYKINRPIYSSVGSYKAMTYLPLRKRRTNIRNLGQG